MPADQPGKLRREQVADILAHVLSVNEFPVGSTEQHAQLSLMVDCILSERVAVDAAEPLGRSAVRLTRASKTASSACGTSPGGSQELESGRLL